MQEIDHNDALDEGYDLRALILALKRRWLVVVVTILVCVALSLFMVLRETPRYTSQALVVLSQSRTALEQERAPLQNNAQINALVSSETRFLTSDNFILDLVRTMRLAAHPEFIPGGVNPHDVMVIPSGSSAPPTSVEALVMASVRGSMSVAREGSSYLISITFVSEDPEFAAELANTAASLLTRRASERGSSTALELAQRVAAQLPALRRDLVTTENYSDQLLMMDIQRLTGAERQNALQKFNNLQAQQDRLNFDAERTLRQAQTLGPSTAQPDGALPYAALGDIESQRSNLYNQKRALWQELVDRGIAGTFTSAEAFEAFQTVDLSRRVYTKLLSRLSDLELEASLFVSGARIFAPALVAHQPSFPKKKNALALSFILGTALGMGLALFMEFFTGVLLSESQIGRVYDNRKIFTLPIKLSRMRRLFLGAVQVRHNAHLIELDRLIDTLDAVEPENNYAFGRVINVMSSDANPYIGRVGEIIAKRLVEEDRMVAVLDFDGSRILQHGFVRRSIIRLYNFTRGRKSKDVTHFENRFIGATFYSAHLTTPARGIRYNPAAIERLINRLTESFDDVVVISPRANTHTDNIVFAKNAHANILVSRFRQSRVADVIDTTEWLTNINHSRHIYSLIIGKG